MATHTGRGRSASKQPSPFFSMNCSIFQTSLCSKNFPGSRPRPVCVAHNSRISTAWMGNHAVFRFSVIAELQHQPIKDVILQSQEILHKRIPFLSFGGILSLIVWLRKTQVQQVLACNEHHGAHQRTLFQVWVAPWGDPATMGTWMGLWLLVLDMLSNLRPRALQVASTACSLASMLSSRWQMVELMEYNRF